MAGGVDGNYGWWARQKLKFPWLNFQQRLGNSHLIIHSHFLSQFNFLSHANFLIFSSWQSLFFASQLLSLLFCTYFSLIFLIYISFFKTQHNSFLLNIFLIISFFSQFSNDRNGQANKHLSRQPPLLTGFLRRFSDWNNFFSLSLFVCSAKKTFWQTQNNKKILTFSWNDNKGCSRHAQKRRQMPQAQAVACRWRNVL